MSTREHSKRLYPGGKERGKARATILDSDDSDSADEPGGDAKMGDLGSDDDENALEGLGLAKSQFRSSTKLDALVQSLNAVRDEDPDVKAVVFSQFTGQSRGRVRNEVATLIQFLQGSSTSSSAP